MFDRNEELTGMADRVYEELAAMSRGEILSRRAIQKITGLTPNTSAWQTVVNKARVRLLKNFGIGTRCERLAGVRLLTVKDQQTWLPEFRTRCAGRHIRKAEVALEAMRDEGMTLHQQQLTAAVLGHIVNARRTLRRELKEQQVLAKPAETHPRVRFA